MPNQLDNIPNNYSSNYQIDDLIGVSPNWLMKSGITILFIVTSVIIALSAFIKYPDKIICNGIMTSENPPIEHVNITAGIIEDIFVSDGDLVDEGQILMQIKNNTNKNDIDRLNSFINKYSDINHIPNYLSLKLPKGLQLGEIQGDFSQLTLLFSQFQQTLNQSAVFDQIHTLQNEIEETKLLRQILIKEKKYSKEELKLVERDFNRNKELNKNGIISDVDKEKIESEWLQYQKQYSNLDQGIIQNKIREEQLVLDKQQLIEERSSKIQSHRFNIDKSINSIQSKIIEWHKNFFVVAEISGEISFIEQIIKDKYITQNTNLLSIIPTTNSNEKQIQIFVTNNGIGKINIEDKVILKVNSYPYKEFGVLTASVSEISELPKIIQNPNGEDSFLYSVKIKLPEKLITNHKVEISFRPNSSVIAEVITKDKSVLYRIFETIISLTS